MLQKGYSTLGVPHQAAKTASSSRPFAHLLTVLALSTPNSAPSCLQQFPTYRGLIP